MKYHTKIRKQKNTKLHISYNNGVFQKNSSNKMRGVFVSVYDNGRWGVATGPVKSKAKIKELLKKANNNLTYLDKNKAKDIRLDNEVVEINKDLRKNNIPTNISEKKEYLKEIGDYINKKYKDLNSYSLNLMEFDKEKEIFTSTNKEGYIYRPLSIIVIFLNYKINGEVFELSSKMFGGVGQFSVNFGTEKIKNIKRNIDKLYIDVKKKAHGEKAESGVYECILDSNISGMLVHEAIGHSVEADFASNSSYIKKSLKSKVASNLINIKDYANNYKGDICNVPIFIDDEGIKAKDVCIVEKGVLKNLLHNQKTASKFNTVSNGNARARYYSSLPIIRMRNTCIEPGENKLKNMISSIDNGYYLIDSYFGEEDSNGRFMFSVNKGYKIENGEIKNPIKNTSINGNAYDVLKSVTMVADKMKWNIGLCDKKQLIPVSMGGPALKCRLKIGGNNK